MMELSIIFVNWNATAYLREALVSIFKHTAGIEFEIIVVDNASPERDIETIEQEFDGVRLIRSADNLGFAKANNLGVSHSSGTYVLFINPDTKLVSPALNVMLRHLESSPEPGIVGCKLLNTDLSIQTSCIQTFPTILNQALDTDFLRARWPKSRLWGTAPLLSDSPEPAAVEVISGACMMMRRDVFDEVGQFSEDYFMYAEDLDLCFKVTRAGYVNHYVSMATVVHHGGASSTPLWATVMKWKSILHYCVKNHGPLYALTFRIVMSAVAALRLVAIVVLSFFGNKTVNNRARFAASTKWTAILRTLLARPGAGPPPPLRAVGATEN